jgi:Pyridoxamine 5'-phosphate oxidase
MAKQFEQIEPAHAAFIAEQHIFFTASAPATGRINISPRGADAFRVLNPNSVAYLDQTGSGNETAAHLRASGRLTIMFCGFENVPMILRLYGHGRSLWRGTPEYAALLETAFGNEEAPGARQIICLDVEMVQTSCGYGVPLFDFKEERQTLRRWAENQGEDGVATYWRKKNVYSIDGFETGVVADDSTDEVGVTGEDNLEATSPVPALTNSAEAVG